MAWEHAVGTARSAEIEELKKDERAALLSSNLDDAKLIASAIESAQADLEVYSGNAKRYIVYANKPWQEIATLPKRDYSVTAVGKWTISPTVPAVGSEGYTPEEKRKYALPEQNPGAFLMRVNGNVIIVGKKCSFSIESDTGVVGMCMDGVVPGDNLGTLSVTIQLH